MTNNETLVSQLKTDFRQATLSEQDRTMLAYAVKLTREPWSMSEEDVSALRRVGFKDSAILDINQVTAYYAFVNRLAQGLGVTLESFWETETG